MVVAKTDRLNDGKGKLNRVVSVHDHFCHEIVMHYTVLRHAISLKESCLRYRSAPLPEYGKLHAPVGGPALGGRVGCPRPGFAVSLCLETGSGNTGIYQVSSHRNGPSL